MRWFARFLWILASLGATFWSGCATTPGAPPVPVALSSEQRLEHNRRVFDRVWELVNDRFFDAKFRGVDWPTMRVRYRPEAEKAKDDEALYGVVNRMLGELKESHNAAMTPRAKFENETHRRARVGIGFQRLEGSWVVTEIVPSSPAAEAGVQPGWLIAARDGRALDQQISGDIKPGQVFNYQFIDGHDQPRTMTLTARDVAIPNRLDVRELAGGVIYLRFDGFDAKSRRWLSDQLKEHRAAPAVIVDLRHNRGGTFFSLEFMLGEFFPERVSLGTFVRRSGTESEKDAMQWLPARYAGRVALLVDGQTASCGEIFAHALHFHHRAVLIGRKTAGAVVVALYYGLPDGGRLQLAIEDFRSLDGQRLEGNGVVPDQVVPLRLADARANRDADLEAALAALNGPVGAVRP
jgi:carboxyl-terminal processing protease